MKRSPELAALSRDHHVALSHALRLKRAQPDDLDRTVAVFLTFLVGDGRQHFAAEEAVLLPELPDGAHELGDRVRAEHVRILHDAARLGEQPAVAAAHALGELMSSHVRFEERELFPVLETLPRATLATLGRRLDAFGTAHSPA